MRKEVENVGCNFVESLAAAAVGCSHMVHSHSLALEGILATAALHSPASLRNLTLAHNPHHMSSVGATTEARASCTVSVRGTLVKDQSCDNQSINTKEQSLALQAFGAYNYRALA